MDLGSIPFVDIAAPVALAVGGLVAAWAIQRRLDHNRTEALRTEAQRLGLNFEDADWTDRHRAPVLKTALFARGHSAKFKNIMTGSRDGLKISILDYSFTEGSGRSTRNYRQTVGAFSKACAYLPSFEMRPSGTADKIWESLAHKNMHFGSNPEFSRRYVLRGALDDKVRLLFAPSLLAFLEGLDPQKKWHIEGAGDTLILYRDAKRTPPAELRMFVEDTSALASGFFGLVSPALMRDL